MTERNYAALQDQYQESLREVKDSQFELHNAAANTAEAIDLVKRLDLEQVEV